MVYLIDDKKVRQEHDYSWTEERFNKYIKVINCVHTLEDLTNRAEEIYSENNIILYHESFLDQTINSNDAIIKRNELAIWSKSKQNKLVYFSGSKNTREINENIAYIPVSILYSNLEIFLNKIEKNEFNLDYLLFGENINIEKELYQKQDISLSMTFDEEAVNPIGSIFLARPFKKYISNPFLKFEEGIFFSDVSDEKFSEKIDEWFNGIKYDNIFIPLCFGDVLSDYNGLRFAMHIRCTKCINQTSNIYIYGFIGINYLLENEYFDILKTKNIFLVNFSKCNFLESINRKKDFLHIDDLPDEIKKINLQVPKNYEDNHSISNEWAIYKWALFLEASDTGIDKISQNINRNLYFKYLKSIFSKNEIQRTNIENLKIKFTDYPKVLYIDDEAMKGWFEVFCKIFQDFNQIDFELFDIDYHRISKDEIVNKAINHIVINDIDIVILDFRLHHTDFINNNLDDVTGLRILKEVKKINPGIQVIIFSATNKIWNLQALLNAGADDFIIKESPDNIFEASFTKDVIDGFIKTMNTSVKRKYLKKVFKYCNLIISNLSKCEFEDDTDYEYFLKDLRKQIQLIKEGCKNINNKNTLTIDIVFLNCYNFLEKFKHFYLKEKNGQFSLGSSDLKMKRYSFFEGRAEDKGTFFRISQNDDPSWFNVLSSLYIDYFQISNIDSVDIKYLNRIKEKRNKYIHESKTNFDSNELLMILSMCELFTKNMSE
jgi:DNA-binding NarL/FixJ family response regulator